MEEKKKTCTKCYGIGRRQEYVGGLVRQVYCDCPKGEMEMLKYHALMRALDSPWTGLPF